MFHNITRSEPVSPGKLLTAQNDLASVPPDNTATQKVQIEYLKKMVSALMVSFTAYRYDTEKKIDSLNESVVLPSELENANVRDNTFLTGVKEEIEQLRNQLNTDVGQLASRCEKIENRIMKLEEKYHFDTETTIVAQNVPVVSGSENNLVKLAEELVHNGTGTTNVAVVRAKRIPSKTSKPGLVKIEFRSLEEKIQVLRNKQKLKNHRVYEKCFLRSSKSHAERLMEANLATLLDHLPIRNQFRVAGNGRLVQNDGAFFHNPHFYSNRPQSSVPPNRSHDGFDRSYPTPSNQGPPYTAAAYPRPPPPFQNYGANSSGQGFERSNARQEGRF